MLVFKRKLNEEVVIDVPPSSVTQRVVVRVCENNRDGLRLGFTADESVGIHRREVMDRIEAGKPTSIVEQAHD